MKIKELFSGPEKWTQGVTARTKDGFFVSFDNPDATCWCLAGAVWKCYGPDSGIFKLIGNEIGESISGFNDDPKTKFQDIKELVEKLDI